jgi:hypothetical protein
VTIGGELFSDAMGNPGTYEGTYIGMIDHNVTTISRALGGNAPARGMSGKLSPQPKQHVAPNGGESHVWSIFSTFRRILSDGWA